MAIHIDRIPGVTNFVDRRNSLPTHPTKRYATRTVEQIRYIVIHHGASSDTATPDQWAEYHTNPKRYDANGNNIGGRDWPGIAYHFVIERDGKVSWTNSLETISYHCGNNTPSVGISLVGNFDERTYTAVQYEMAVNVAQFLGRTLGLSSTNVYGHKEVPNGTSTSCPGKNFDMNQFRRDFKSSDYTTFSHHPMPTGSDYVGIDTGQHGQVNLGGRLSGTDKWNDLIVEVAKEQGVNPVFLKVIMANESAGEQGAGGGGYNKAYGLMQVHRTADNNDQFDWAKLGAKEGRANAKYQIEAGVKIIKQKITAAGSDGIHEVAWRFRGKWSESHPKFETGKTYADQTVTMYRGLGFNPDADTVLTNPVGVESYSYRKGSTDYLDKPTGDRLTESGRKLMDLHHPSMMKGTPPNIEDDDYPDHRYGSNPFALRIGDSQFFIPPTAIKTSKVTMIDSKHIVRSKSPQMTKSGFTTNRLDIRLVFADTDQINGFKVSAPGGKEYYMDGLRSLLAQFYRNPMLPIRNELINDRHGILNVALMNIHIQTEEELTGLLVVDLSLLECTMEPYFALPEYMYDLMINYPLWRWHYQQMLLDDTQDRHSSMYLRPVGKHLNGKTFFRTLEPTYIEHMKEDVIKNAEISANNSDKRTYVNPEFALSNFQIDDIRELMEDWNVEGLITTKVQLGIEKQMTPIHVDSHEIPSFQDIGGVERVFTMSFTCTSREQLESLQSMVSHAEETARDYRHRFVGGFIEVHNEIINMAGIEFAMVVDIQTATFEEHPDVYAVDITFKEFNPNQKNQERLNGINYKMTELSDLFDEREEVVSKTNMKPTIMYESQIEKLLNNFELYPDLELPTYEVANAAVKQINDYRRKRGQSLLPYEELPRAKGDVWVEPDFFMLYPSLEDAYRAINAGDFGAKMINLMIDGSYEDIYENYNELNVGETLEALSSNFRDNSFNVHETQEVFEQTADLTISYDMANDDYTIDAFRNWDEDALIPDVQETAAMMLHDMYKYDNRFRLTRAFPTYLLLFVDEGQWVDGKRLWNNYYAYHSINDITVTKDKDNPVDLAYIRLSNTYGTFNYSSKLTDPRESKGTTLWDRSIELWKSFWHFTVTEKMIAENSVLMDHAKLKQGARVHLRLGYSSNAHNLPIAFNGKIASVNDGPEIDMLCQGDGAELIARPISTDPNEGSPNEPHNCFMEYLPKRASNYWYGASSEFEFLNNHESYYGIEHFGWVESTAGGEDGVGTQSFWSFGTIGDFFSDLMINAPTWMASGITGHPTFSVYDIMKNIYRGSLQPQTGVINYEHFDMFSLESWAKFDDYAVDAAKRLDVFDGEKNVNFSVYNKTLWDLGQHLSMFVPEFICAPHPHGLRSTLFFGMPHWPVKYEYRQKDNTTGETVGDYVEAYKPYQQLHTYVTGTDIIRNNIQASDEHIHHIVTGVYLRGDTSTAVTSETVYADRSIFADHQKQMIIDTGVYQDLFGPDAALGVVNKYGLKPAITGIVGLAELVGEALGGVETLFSSIGKPWGWEPTTRISDWIDNLDATENTSDFMEKFAQPGKVAATSITIGALQRSFTKMYQGELVIFGDPSVKPIDLFTLSDTHLQLGGTAQVGAVTHSLSRTTGFTTVIRPELVVGRTDGRANRNYVIQLVSALGTAAAGTIVRKVLLSKAFRKLLDKTASASWSKVKQAGDVVDGQLNKNLKGQNISRTAKTGFEKIDDIAKSQGFKKTAGKLMRVVKSNVVFSLTLGAVQEYFMTWYDKETKYNNVIYIYPLWKLGQPFVAGIKGGMHIIPNYIDANFADPMMTKRAVTFDGKGENVENKTIVSDGKVDHPLRMKARISSNYGQRDGGMHYGVDFLPTGYDSKGRAKRTHVYNVADGEVVLTRPNSDTAGNYVDVKHTINGKDYVTTYMHLEEIKCSEGPIKRGETIGIMGKTGRVSSSSGNDPTHLHFEVFNGSVRDKDDVANRINPVTWLREQGVDV